MSKQETVYQVMTNGKYGMPTLHDWYTDKQLADDFIKFANETNPNLDVWIEEGTDHIYQKCRCGSIHVNLRYDAHGIETGYWCDDCYDDSSKYPYRKDKYFDPSYAGERLEDDY
jgi:hypothetical protein